MPDPRFDPVPAKAVDSAQGASGGLHCYPLGTSVCRGGRGLKRSSAPPRAIHPLAEACAAPVKRPHGRLAGPVPQLCTEGRAHAASRLPSLLRLEKRCGGPVELLALRRLGPIQGKPPEVLGLLALRARARRPPPSAVAERRRARARASGRPASSRVFSEEEPRRPKRRLCPKPTNLSTLEVGPRRAPRPPSQEARSERAAAQ